MTGATKVPAKAAVKLAVKRGDLVTIAVAGDFGKPRPALVIQANPFNQHATLTVLPVTSTLVNAPLLRVTVPPSAANGLAKPSQVMVDKTLTLKREKIGSVLGRVEASTLLEVERCLAVFLGIAK